jgi:cell division protein FtsQ
VQQDRLSARKLFFRRLRKNLKPGFYVLGMFVVVVMLSGLFRSVHFSAITVRGFGLADVAAGLGFRVSHIVVQGDEATDPAALAAAIGVKIGDPSFGISLNAVQARVAALGPVQTVSVQRAWPGTLIVSLTERASFGIWQTADTPPRFVLIDKAGNVIADQDAAVQRRRQPGLMLFAGADAPANAAALMGQLAAAPAVAARVVAAQRMDGLRWNLVLKDRTVVKLPETGVENALAELATLESSMSLLDRPVEFVDVRVPGRLVVRPYPAAVKESGNE